MVCLVCWWFGGWWCVVLCVGVGGVLLGFYTLVVCVLVSWRGGAHVCVFLRGCCPHCGLVVLVCWWCAAWGVAALWCGVLVVWCVGAHVRVFLMGLLPPSWFGGVGVLVVCCLGALHHCGLVVWVVALVVHKCS